MVNLILKFKAYRDWVKSHQDSHGFIESQECDSLLFSSLLGCVTGTNVNIEAAKDSEGRWLRRPADAAPCYDCSVKWSLKERLILLYEYWKANGVNKEEMKKIFERGGSSISRDMLVGLAWYCWVNKRLDLSESVIKYALSHGMKMGEGTPTRTIMTPGLLNTYAWISYRLGGPSRRLLRYIPQSESKSVVDFQAHLSVLHIMLRNKLTGKNKYSKLLLKQAQREPNNALFQIAAGYKDAAKVLLANEKWFPSDRLPTTHDRYEQYLFQRDYGSDWEPDLNSPKKEHSGADFLFCYYLLNIYDNL